MNALNASELKARTKRFGLRVMKLVDALPNTMAGRAIGSQLVRCGTSVGAGGTHASRLGYTEIRTIHHLQSK